MGHAAVSMKKDAAVAMKKHDPTVSMKKNDPTVSMKKHELPELYHHLAAIAAGSPTMQAVAAIASGPTTALTMSPALPSHQSQHKALT